MKLRHKVEAITGTVVLGATVLVMLWWWTAASDHPEEYPADVLVSVLLTELILAIAVLVLEMVAMGASRGD